MGRGLRVEWARGSRAQCRTLDFVGPGQETGLFARSGGLGRRVRATRGRVGARARAGARARGRTSRSACAALVLLPLLVLARVLLLVLVLLHLLDPLVLARQASLGMGR